MEENWITLDGMQVEYKLIPGLLDRFNLLPNFLRKLIETKNIYNIKLNQEEQIKFFKQFLIENKLDNKEALNKWLSRNGLDERRLDLLLYERLQIERFKIDRFDSEVDKIFLDQKNLFDKVMYSILKIDNQGAALELFTQLEERESTFAELASKYTLGAEKQSNGQVGPIEFRYVLNEIRERLLISKDGQLWPPFSIQNYWFILRHEKTIPCTLDNVMRKRIRDDIYEKWINEKVLKIVKQIRGNKIKENPESSKTPSTSPPPSETKRSSWIQRLLNREFEQIDED